ncbi:hypothetical protein D3C72_685250 [compost metagenome]
MLVDTTDVTGSVPTFLNSYLGGLRITPVAGKHHRPTTPDFAVQAGGQWLQAGRIDDSDLTKHQHLAVGVGMGETHFVGPKGHRATKFGNAVHLLHFHADGQTVFDQPEGNCRGAAGHGNQAAAIDFLFFCQGQQCLKHHRHSHQAGDALAGDHLPDLCGVEVRQQHRGATFEHVGQHG